MGRSFSDDDRLGTAPVAIINETMARNFWPNEDPIGKRFRFADDQSGPWLTVIGVAGDMHRQGLEKQVAPQVFRSLSQSPDNELDILVRTTSDPIRTADAVRAEIQSIDKNVAKFGVTTVEKRLGEETAERRFHTSLIGLFSLISLFLAAVGIYGLMQHLVMQRTHEIGVRMALGARYTGVVGLVLKQGLTLAGIGIAAGIIGAFCFTRMLSSLLFNVSDTDPVTFMIAPAILVSVAALACWLPARRAARIDPMVALRQD
jgi:putative ABC transport system permease protein